jgi:hypothetical protein
MGRKLLLFAGLWGGCGGGGFILLGLSGGSLLGFGLFLSRGELLLCGSLYRREKDTLVNDFHTQHGFPA